MTWFDRRIAKAALGEFRDVFGHGCGRIDLTFRHQHSSECPGEGLGHGHCDVLLVRLQGTGVALEHEPPAVQDHDAVGVGQIERVTEGDRAAVHGRSLDLAEVLHVARQRRCGARSAPYVDGRHELADVAPGPAELREFAERAVGECDRLVRRRRKARHPGEGSGIAICGIWRCRRGHDRRTLIVCQLDPLRQIAAETSSIPRAWPPGSRVCRGQSPRCCTRLTKSASGIAENETSV